MWVIDTSSKEAIEVVKSDAVLADPQWSPDGMRLAYVSRPTPKADDERLSDVYIADVVGSSAPRKLLDNDGPDDMPRWSPDGKWIALNSRDTLHGRLGIPHLVVIPAEGGKTRDLTTDPDGVASDISWSGDGTYLYFRAAHHTTAQLYRVAVQGSSPEALTREEATTVSFGYVSRRHADGILA